MLHANQDSNATYWLASSTWNELAGFKKQERRQSTLDRVKVHISILTMPYEGGYKAGSISVEITWTF